MAPREENLNEKPSAGEKLIKEMLLLTASSPAKFASFQMVAYPKLGGRYEAQNKSDHDAQ